MLVVFGDQDEFTSISSYRTWAAELETHSGTSDRLKTVEVGSATHFWRGQAGERLQHVAGVVAIIFFGMLCTFPYYHVRRNSCTIPSNTQIGCWAGWSYGLDYLHESMAVFASISRTTWQSEDKKPL